MTSGRDDQWFETWTVDSLVTDNEMEPHLALNKVLSPDEAAYIHVCMPCNKRHVDAICRADPGQGSERMLDESLQNLKCSMDLWLHLTGKP